MRGAKSFPVLPEIRITIHDVPLGFSCYPEGSHKGGSVFSEEVGGVITTLTPEQYQDVARRFQGLTAQWSAATRYRSNIHALRNHPVCRELVALGEPVVPLILAELERETDVSWFTVLTAITGENPVPPALAGRVDEMARAWLDWGRQRGYAV
jgi:hypothetical protein